MTKNKITSSIRLQEGNEVASRRTVQKFSDDPEKGCQRSEFSSVREREMNRRIEERFGRQIQQDLEPE